MKIIKVEVRTTYYIEYSINDLWKIIREAKEDETNFQKFFYKYDGENSTLEDVKDLFESLNGFNGDELKYIAYKLGFDGWSNAGIYDKNRHVRTFIVYRYGDTLQ